MTKNDLILVEQMVAAGLYQQIPDLMTQSREEKVKIQIEQMGTKWRLHPDNYVKRVDYV